MMSFVFSGVGMGQLLECAQQITRLVHAASRRNIREFLDILWREVAREINPTPRGLSIEINPALKTHYSVRNRTFIVTLSLQQSGADFMPQFVYGGAAAGPVNPNQYAQQSAATRQIEQTRSTRAELEAEREMAADAQQQADMIQATPTAELHPDGLQKREQVVARAERTEEAGEERVAQLEQRVEQMEKTRDIIAQDQTLGEERERRDTQQAADLATTQENAQEAARVGEQGRQEAVEVGDEIRAGQSMDQPTATPTVESQIGTALEEEEKESDIQELRTFNRILRQQVLPHVDLRIVRQPMIMTAAEGDAIVMEVATDSFRDTRRVNVNMPPITRPW